jgi:threonylcarbamoyladenosine tRNA methylthiotransferase MtaB
MGRRYTLSDYRKAIDAILNKMPLAGIGTDLITGLPGEDDRAFSNTVQAVREMPFGNLHVFPFSPRPGTRAELMPGRPPAAETRRRVAALLALGRLKREAFARSFAGRQVEVLVESVDGGAASGWTREYLPALVGGAAARVNDILVSTVCGTAGETLLAGTIPPEAKV